MPRGKKKKSKEALQLAMYFLMCTVPPAGGSRSILLIVFPDVGKAHLIFFFFPLAIVLKFLEKFMFRISSSDRTGNWLGGTVLKEVLSKSLEMKYVLP